MASISLKTLLVSSKNVTVGYPGFPDLTVDVAFLSRETLVALRKKATKHTFKNRQPVEELDDDLFLQLYVQACIRGWKGFKLAYLEQLAPVDITGQSLEDELEYSEENALFLMKSSTNFDAFISDTVSDLGKFQKSSAPK